jgi:cytochrome d ubiquinol oxidase subunit II
MTLAATWFILIFVLLGGYAVLDGFDLGVGVLHLLARGEHERRVSINAIAPVWDGNEVWLLTAGGALFAAFPAVYATVFSGFYIALMLVLTALIFRAVAMEFRGKVDSPRWRAVWDKAFGISSLLLPILFGVALGNVLRGIPIEHDKSTNIGFFALLNPFALLVGVLSLATCVMQGAVYLVGKTDGIMRQRSSRCAGIAYTMVVALFVLASAVLPIGAPVLLQSTAGLLPVVLLLILFIAAALVFPFALRHRRPSHAFVASSAMVLSMVGLAGAGLFPRLLPERGTPGFSLTIYNSASTPRTLGVMLVIALIGMPLVIAYTIVIHCLFRGRVVLGKDSY